ncbi:MAG: site-2 protease family protein [Candidatus Wallbacteria bacterium]
MYISNNKKLINIALIFLALYVANALISTGRSNFTGMIVNIFVIPLGIFAIIAHEIAHGYCAYILGDPTAKLSGRLSLNPIKHFDPIGVLSMIFFHIGWAKPVPVNYSRLNNPRRDIFLVSMAGPLTNLSLAFISACVLKFLYYLLKTGSLENIAAFTSSPALFIKTSFEIIAVGGIQINLMLFIFNLIPIPPLDGSKMFMCILPHELARQYEELEKYGLFILIALVYTNSLSYIILPPMKICYEYLFKFIIT